MADEAAKAGGAAWVEHDVLPCGAHDNACRSGNAGPVSGSACDGFLSFYHVHNAGAAEAADGVACAVQNCRKTVKRPGKL